MEIEKEGAPISITLIKPTSIDTPYRDHAKNYLGTEPENPPPVYAPDIVAKRFCFARSTNAGTFSLEAAEKSCRCRASMRHALRTK